MIRIHAFSLSHAGPFETATKSLAGVDVSVSDPAPLFSQDTLTVQMLDLQENRNFLTLPLARSLLAQAYYINDSQGKLVRLKWSYHGSAYGDLCNQEMVYLNSDHIRRIIAAHVLLKERGRPELPLEKLILSFLEVALSRGNCLLTYSILTTQDFE